MKSSTRPVRRAIPTLCRSEQLIRQIEDGAPGAAVHHAMDLRELVAECRDRFPALVIYETAFDGLPAHPNELAFLASLSSPVLVVSTGGRAAVSDVREFAMHAGPYFSFAISSDEAVALALNSIMQEGSVRSAVPIILGRLCAHLSGCVRDAVVLAVLMGEHGVRVDAWTARVGCALSTLRDRFRQRGVAAPHVWLGCIRSAFVAFRCLELEMDQNIAAKKGGFQDPSACAHSFRLYTGKSLSDWESLGGFAAVLKEIERRCLVFQEEQIAHVLARRHSVD